MIFVRCYKKSDEGRRIDILLLNNFPVGCPFMESGTRLDSDNGFFMEFF